MADSDVHEAIQLDADISALVEPSVSELWRAMHGYPAEATGAVAAHRALAGGGGGLPTTGGTLTGELIIDTAASNDQALELQGTRTGNVKTFGIDYPNTTLDITSDGVVDLRSADTLAVNFEGDGNTGAGFSVQNQPAGQIFQVNVKNGARAVIIANNQNDGNALLQLIGSAEFHVQSDGTPRLFAHAAPADGDLTAGECALWFDQTNGAAKLMIKGKSADGTVVTGNVTLT